MTTYTTQFSEQLGASNEVYNVTIDYCEDFTGDGFHDIRVTLALDDASNSGTEDLLGIAFDIQNDATAGLSIVEITRDTSNGTLSSAEITWDIEANNVGSQNGNAPLNNIANDGIGGTTPFNTSGDGSDAPYDVGIKVSDQGSGEGIVQTMSFVITGGEINLDAEALLENTNWWIRTQSTDGGEGSAKTGGFIGDLPPCDDDDDDVTFEVEKAISNIVIYADCDGDDVLGNSITKIKFDNFDLLDCDEDGVTAKDGDDDDERFELTLDQLYEALGAVGKSDCIILGVTIKAGDNDGGFSRGEGQFFDADEEGVGIDTGNTARADHTFEAADYADIWC